MNRAGHSLLEMMIAIAVIGTVALAVISLQYQTALLNRLNADQTRAQNAARNVSDDLLGRDPREAFDAYRTAPDFFVPGLVAANGRVTFPQVDGEVREDVVNPALGMPRDLNGDGVISRRPVYDYKILPVRIAVEWRRPGGERGFYVLHLVLGAR